MVEIRTVTMMSGYPPCRAEELNSADVYIVYVKLSKPVSRRMEIILSM